MTRRQLFKNFGLGLAGILALPLFGKPGKASEPELEWAGYTPMRDLRHGVPGLSEQTYDIAHYKNTWSSNPTMHTGPLTLERVDDELRAVQMVRFS